MQVHRDQASITAISDPQLHSLIKKCVASLSGFDDLDLSELVTFIVVEPGDALETIDAALGFAILSRPFELLADHPGWYEVVFVLSDDGYGVEVFVPKALGIPPELLSMCLGGSS